MSVIEKLKEDTVTRLSPQQQQAMSMIREWGVESRINKPFVLAGYAGTGKTTLAKYIAADFCNVLFCSYTGKAASVMRDKGCNPASTIHSLLYKPKKNNDGEVRFVYAPELALTTANLVIVDEFSMLPQSILDDLYRANRKILFLGDPFQLPPIRGEGSLTPDITLDEIHRQALDSPILKAANDIRTGKPLVRGDYGDFVYKKLSEFDESLFTQVDQLIVGTNRTKDAWDKSMMEELGIYSAGCFNRGQKVMCLMNNRESGLFNGMIGEIHSWKRANHDFVVNFKCDGVMYKNLPVFGGDISTPKRKFQYRKDINRFGYAYAITCHKSQGSEFNSILIYNEAFGKTEEDKRKWLYTAVTRGSKKVYLADRG